MSFSSRALPSKSARVRDRSSRMLVDVRANDLAQFPIPLAIRSGQLASVGRTGPGRFVDGNGMVGTAPYGLPRFDVYDADADGVRETVTALFERATTNRVQFNTNFSQSPWTANNTPTRVANAVRAGDLTLDLIGDTSASLVASYTQTITFVGDGLKSLVVPVKKGTIPAAGGSLIQLRDTTSSADRLNVLLTWSGTTPVLTPATGTPIASLQAQYANGILTLPFQTTSVTASQTHVLTIAPAATAAQQGNLYVGRVQADDAPIPTSLIDTPSAATQSRSADTLTIPMLFQPQVCTLYYKAVFSSPGQARADNLVMIGSDDITSGAQDGFGLYRDTASGFKARVVSSAAGTDALFDASTLLAAAPNAAHEVLATFSLSAVTVAFDGGSAVSAALSLSAFTNFATTNMKISGDNNIRLIECKLAAGLRTWAQMRTP